MSRKQFLLIVLASVCFCIAVAVLYSYENDNILYRRWNVTSIENRDIEIANDFFSLSIILFEDSKEIQLPNLKRKPGLPGKERSLFDLRETKEDLINIIITDNQTGYFSGEYRVEIIRRNGPLEVELISDSLAIRMIEGQRFTLRNRTIN